MLSQGFGGQAGPSVRLDATPSAGLAVPPYLLLTVCLLAAREPYSGQTRKGVAQAVLEEAESRAKGDALLFSSYFAASCNDHHVRKNEL